MRILLSQWGDLEHQSLIDVIKRIEERGHKIVYWVSTCEEIPRLKSQFPKTIFHDYRDAMMGVNPKEVDASSFEPPGKELIEKLYKTESLVLTMMNKHHGNFHVSERKHLYYQLLQYWQGVIKQYKPDAVIFPVPPHATYDFIIYSLAKLFGIKTVMFYATEVGDRLISMTDFETGSEVFLTIERKNSEYDFSLNDLSPDIREYYEKYEKNEYIKPLSLKIFLKTDRWGDLIFKKIKIIWNGLKSHSFFPKMFRYLAVRFGQNLKKEYMEAQKSLDLTKKFIYLPLQYQPEMTTSPLGEMFVDQRLMLEILSVSVPDDWEIYVKEHPTQWSRVGVGYTQHRYRGYYTEISKLKNVRIVPIAASTHDLMNMAQVVATNTGTIAREAVLRLRPAIVFGYPWFQHIPGLTKVSDVYSCKQAISEIINGSLPSKQKIINYLACFDKASFHGYLDPFNKKYSRLTEDENVTNLTKELVRMIEG